MKTPIKILLTALCLATAPLQASWSFSYSLVAGCGGGSYVPALPAIGGLPSKAQCESLRAQILAIKSCAVINNAQCCDYYNCAPCSGYDDASGGAGSPGGTTNLQGEAQGKPFFSNSQNTELQDWKKESEARLKLTMRSAIHAPTSGNPKFDANYQKQLRSAFSKRPKSSRVPGSYKTQGYTTAPGDERTTDDGQDSGGFKAAGSDEAKQAKPISGPGVHMGKPDTPPGQKPAPDDTPVPNPTAAPTADTAQGDDEGFKPAGSDEAKQAQPIGGAGIQQGKPDTPPPPNPVPAENPKTGKCPKKGLWFNDDNGVCYPSKDSCHKGDFNGNCYQSL